MSELKDKIYKVLYEKSRVDVIRLINEDEWPINELVSLIKQERIRYGEWLIGEDESGYADDKGFHDAKSGYQVITNSFRAELRQRNKGL